MQKRRNLIGEQFGRWTVIDSAPDKVTASGYHNIMWRCRCKCGTIKEVRGKSLLYGDSTSCGCFAKENMSNATSKHHGFGTRLYNVWDSMRQRCRNPRNHAYRHYGGRGISICKEWNDFSNFRMWAMANGYDADAEFGKCTIDRIDCNGDYSPTNCRWTDVRTQANNKRDSIWLEYKGKHLPLTKWAEIVGLDYTTLWKRYKLGKTPEQILHK